MALTMALWMVYLAVTGNLEISNLIVGLVLALGIAWLVPGRGRSLDWRRLPTALLALGQYLALLAWELIVSGLEVARVVLDPGLPINPGIVAIPSDCETPLGAALSAHAITLTPGELVVEMEDAGILYTHCLDVTHADDLVAEAQRQRRQLLNRIFS